MTFKDTDNTDVVLRRFRGVGRTAVAGIFSPDKAEQAEKLAYQELGTVDIPQRQTVAPAFDEGEDAVVDGIARGLSQVIEGRTEPADVAERTGRRLVGAIRAKINSNTPPPLADSTLANRRARGNTSRKTLVDTGDMRDAIEHVVVQGEFADG